MVQVKGETFRTDGMQLAQCMCKETIALDSSYWNMLNMNEYSRIMAKGQASFRFFLSFFFLFSFLLPFLSFRSLSFLERLLLARPSPVQRISTPGQDMFSPPDIDNEEAANFLSMMPVAQFLPDRATQPSHIWFNLPQPGADSGLGPGNRWRSKLMILVNAGLAAEIGSGTDRNISKPYKCCVMGSF